MSNHKLVQMACIDCTGTFTRRECDRQQVRCPDCQKAHRDSANKQALVKRREADPKLCAIDPLFLPDIPPVWERTEPVRIWRREDQGTGIAPVGVRV